MTLIGSLTIANPSLTDTQIDPVTGNITLLNRVSGQMVIYLFDAATGRPANGNGVAVSYTQNINGIITDEQINIMGQSAVIYSGVLSSQDPSNPFFTDFQIISIGSAPDVPPPAYSCNLVINFITVDHNESAPGAANGQITVNASSSYGPVMYSLDNVNFQASTTFTGLTGGAKTVYVKDANGCTANANVTVLVQTNLLISDPSVAIPTGNVSRWNAAFNPIVFTYQRKDFEVTAVSLDTVSGSAALSVNCDTTLISNTLAANTLAAANAAALNIVLTDINAVNVYVKAGVYSGTFQVLSVSGTGKLIINTPYTVNATGFINIDLMRPYYQVRTQITYTDPLSGRQNTIVSTNRPNNTGLTKADISSFLQSVLNTKDDSNFTLHNFRDENLSASYQVAYAEYWERKLTAGQALSYIPIANPYYVLYAAKQLGDHYGGNLAAYVPFRTVTDSSHLAKWITDFIEPAYSNGYPFDIGFIYSDDLVGLQLYCALAPLDINRNPLPGSPFISYLLNDEGSWLLNQDGSKLIIADQGAVDITIPARLGLNRLLVNGIFPPEAFYFTLTLQYNDGETAVVVTQTQTVRIDDAIDEQSVYLRWIGLTGSWNYYRFVFNQEISLDVQNAIIIKNYVFDWENQNGIEEVISKNAGQKMKVMAEDLSVADIKGLQSIKYSPKVQMLVNKNPVKWQTVVLNTATFTEYETLNGHGPFSITFNLPAINIQTQ